MSGSAYVDALNDIQKATTALLKPLGFRKSGRSYNRAATDGVVQVVKFQMGEYPIGEYVIPGIRESLYGHFTVNVGVMLPAVREWEGNTPIKGCVHDHHCEIRGRLGNLNGAKEMVWRRLDRDLPATTEWVVSGLGEQVLPFFDRFDGYERVLQVLDREGVLPLKNAGRAALAGAMICVSFGRHERARRWFDVAAVYGASTGHPAFGRHVAEMRQRCGM
jgi:hypothetical protein